jgi:ATP-dependent Lhr-like helicase
MSIGTIVSDPMVTVKFGNGRKLGTIEESFLARMQPNDTFHFAGRQLSLVRLQGLDAIVRVARNTRGPIPRWAGGRFSLSTQLADSMRDLIDEISRGPVYEPEVEHVMPLLNLQREWSEIPRSGELLIERTETRDGYHVFMFPFAGRAVHEGLSQVLAWRLAQLKPTSFALSSNDYGFELLSRDPPPLLEALKTDLFNAATLSRDIRESLNETELARRQFRNIARIAGLVFTGFPGQNKSLKQIQSTTGLVYDVFERYDPDNPLMQQARREVLELQLQEDRLRAVLERMESSDIHIVDTPALTPFAFPIAVDRLRETVVSTEKLADRVRRLQRQLEKRART